MDQNELIIAIGQMDFGRFFRAQLSDIQARRRELLLVVAFALFAFGLSWNLSEILIYAAIGLVAYVLIFLVAAPYFAWSLGFHKLTSVKIDDDGLSFVSGSSTVRRAWSLFKRSRESRKYYFLRQRDVPVSIIFLKSSFASSTDEARFRDLLRSHTKSTLRSNLDIDGPTNEIT